MVTFSNLTTSNNINRKYHKVHMDQWQSKDMTLKQPKKLTEARKFAVPNIKICQKRLRSNSA